MSGEIKRRNKSSKAKKADITTEDRVETKSSENKDSKNKIKNGQKDDVNSSSEPPPPKFGPMPKLSPHRLWSRTALILGLMTIVWYNAGKKNETSLASVSDDIRFRGMKTKCSSGFDQAVSKYPACVPNHCGRIITDEIVSLQEIHALNDLVERVFKVAKQEAAAATVFDLTTGTLKYGGQTLDLIKANKTKRIFEDGDSLIFQSIKSKLMRMVSSYFGVDYWSIFLASPTYISKLTQKPPKTKADEYWHVAAHKELHETYDYSTTLFLSDMGGSLGGGRLIFVDGDQTNRTVESKKGRAIGFTSGEENKHFHERVSKGSRYALTVGFTCDSTKAMKDPVL